MSSSYNEYLKTNDWKEKRELKIRKNYRCAICGSDKNVDVHHLSYRNLTDVKQSDLRKLCRRCHYLAHDLIKSRKLKFRNDNHNSRFILTKMAVKKSLGLSNINLFSGTPLARGTGASRPTDRPTNI